MCKVPGQKNFEEDLYDYESSKKLLLKFWLVRELFKLSSFKEGKFQRSKTIKVLKMSCPR